MKIFTNRGPVSLPDSVRQVTPVCENCRNSWTVQASLMKLQRWAQLIQMCVLGKNENSCSISCLIICPMISLTHNGQITQTLKEKEFSFLPMTHTGISWAHMWSFIRLSCTVQALWQFLLTDFVCSQFLEKQKVYLSCAHCMHSVISNSQGIRNPLLEDTCVFVWEQHTTGDDETQRGSSV